MNYENDGINNNDKGIDDKNTKNEQQEQLHRLRQQEQ